MLYTGRVNGKKIGSNFLKAVFHNFTWSILEHLVQDVLLRDKSKIDREDAITKVKPVTVLKFALW